MPHIERKTASGVERVAMKDLRKGDLFRIVEENAGRWRKAACDAFQRPSLSKSKAGQLVWAVRPEDPEFNGKIELPF
jgi:hypothetical protein